MNDPLENKSLKDLATTDKPVNSDLNTLLACPFCGEIPDKIIVAGECRFICDKNDHYVEVCRNTKEKAIKTWNTRAS